MDNIDKYEQYFEQKVQLEIDRPKRSKHQEYGFNYEVNYGFVPNTKAGDWHEIDAYVLDQKYPLTSFYGNCFS